MPWTEIARFRCRDGLVHATYMQVLDDKKDGNAHLRFCRALRGENIGPLEDAPLTCIICILNAGA